MANFKVSSMDLKAYQNHYLRQDQKEREIESEVSEETTTTSTNTIETVNEVEEPTTPCEVGQELPEEKETPSIKELAVSITTESENQAEAPPAVKDVPSTLAQATPEVSVPTQKPNMVLENLLYQKSLRKLNGTVNNMLQALNGLQKEINNKEEADLLYTDVNILHLSNSFSEVLQASVEYQNTLNLKQITENFMGNTVTTTPEVKVNKPVVNKPVVNKPVVNKPVASKTKKPTAPKTQPVATSPLQKINVTDLEVGQHNIKGKLYGFEQERIKLIKITRIEEGKAYGVYKGAGPTWRKDEHEVNMATLRYYEKA